MSGKNFSSEALRIDCAAEADKISNSVRMVILQEFKRRGVVLGLSGGIDSSVTAALCVRALGKQRVLGVLMPEKESSGDTLHLSDLIADHLEIETVHEDITAILEASGCYRRRDEAIQTVIPEYAPGYKCKIVLPSVIEDDRYRIFSVVVQSPEGKEIKSRLGLHAYLQVVAASNFKQSTRKMVEYYHAERKNYAVAGTPNRLEYDQGFFVKGGDGAADVKPIAHLYKTQVYQLARYLGIPEEICSRPPTTDTYSMPQSQEEFDFSLPYDKMDLCLYGRNCGISAEETAEIMGLTADQVKRIYADIDHKRSTTRYLHSPPVLVETVKEVSTRSN